MDQSNAENPAIGGTSHCTRTSRPALPYIPDPNDGEDSGSDMESFALRNNALEEIDRPVNRKWEYNQAIDHSETRAGRIQLLYTAATAFRLHEPFWPSSEVEEIIATIRWAQPAVSLFTIRFLLSLLNKATTKVVLAFDISFRDELDSFPWAHADAELARAPWGRAENLLDIKLIIYVPHPDWNAELGNLYDKLPAFKNVLEEHDIVCEASLVNNYTYIVAQQHRISLFE